ncbi:MAG TPA: hypothetical protein VFG05_08685 [Methylocella sp.]|nr:hypothetical protein [Methylocella sp.]
MPLWHAWPVRALEPRPLRPAPGREELLSISGTMRNIPPMVSGAKGRHAEDL